MRLKNWTTFSVSYGHAQALAAQQHQKGFIGIGSAAYGSTLK
jgi:hypothetical protein